jgi:LysR family nitrogen assimilation transcriptional regulator
MDIRALRYFQTVAECGSYTRGSEMLRISQPAVSRTIRGLEAEIGRPLFRRHGHGVTLTDAGKLLLERAQTLLRQIEQTKAEIRSGGAGPSGLVSLAVPPAAGQYLVPALVTRLAASLPNVSLKVVAGYSGYISELLVRGQIDIACVHDPLPERGFEIFPLVAEEVFLVGKAGAFPRTLKEIGPKMLVDLPLILPSRPNASRRLLDAWVGHLRTQLHARIEVDDHTVTRALVKAGVGYSLLTRCAIDADLARGEVEARPFRPKAVWPLALLARESPSRSAVVEAVMTAVRETVRDLVDGGGWPGQGRASADKGKSPRRT